MSTRLELKSEYQVSAQNCLALMSDPELHKELRHLPGMANRQARNMTVENGFRRWQVEVELLQSVPAFARELIPKGQLKWVQKFELDLSTLEFTIQVDQPLPARTLEVHGTGRIREISSDRSSFEIELNITSQLPLIGRRFESLLAGKFTKMMEVDMEIRRTYIEQNRHRLEARDSLNNAEETAP